MRSFFGYQTDGLIWKVESITGGFPSECKAHDPTCSHPYSKSIRDGMKPPVVGFVEFVCGCPSTQKTCLCARVARDNHYVNAFTRKLEPKPHVELIIDGKAVATESQLNCAPGSKVTLQLRSDKVPDGATVEVRGSMLHCAFPEPVTIKFSSGMSEAVSLIAPAQGLTGSLFTWGKFVKRLRLSIRGFA